MTPERSTVRALLIGIDDYDPTVANPLRGCVGDVGDVREFLIARVPDLVEPLVLRNGEATRAALVSAFTTHLGAAGEGDVALFWFSGHGSQEPVPAELAHLEPSGFQQTLLCADSRTGGVPDLADKDLNALIGRVAARGAHVVVVTDCCHSGGNTRDADGTERGTDPAAAAPPLAGFTSEVRALARDTGALPVPVPHVALAACRSAEKARERPVDGRVRGVFTASLLAALARLGTDVTYRDLLVAARCRVENHANQQVPQLYPTDVGGLADRRFLGGRVVRPTTAFVLRCVRGTWEVDAGRCHGIPQPVPGDPVLFSVPGAGVVRVTEVRPDRSLVEPVGWEPHVERQYPVVLATFPLPPATVVLDGGPDDATALRRVHRALATAGPDGGPSPLVRPATDRTQAMGLQLRVAAAPGGGYRVLRGDGTPAAADVADETAADARIVVAQLEHIARWTHIKDLDNPASPLAELIRVEVVAAGPGDTLVAWERPALVPDENGAIRLHYVHGRPPQVFVRLHNLSGRPLYAVLLDLTDRYRVTPALFPGGMVRGRAAALDGRPMPVSLPKDRAVPGEVRDWLKLIVADEEFASAAFTMPPLGEPVDRSARAFRARGFVDRLGLRATSRDFGDEVDVTAAGDWATVIVPVLTTV